MGFEDVCPKCNGTGGVKNGCPNCGGSGWFGPADQGQARPSTADLPRTVSDLAKQRGIAEAEMLSALQRHGIDKVSAKDKISRWEIAKLTAGLQPRVKTVAQLSADLGKTVSDFLAQLEAAGMYKTGPDDSVAGWETERLLEHLINRRREHDLVGPVSIKVLAKELAVPPASIARKMSKAGITNISGDDMVSWRDATRIRIHFQLKSNSTRSPKKIR